MTSIRASRSHVALVGVIILVAGIVAGSDPLYAGIVELISWCESLISRAPLLGAAAFVLLAAPSAMLFFFSSTVLVPVGVHAWGPGPSFLLLWLGWFAGGAAAFAIGRYLGLTVVRRLIGEHRIERFEGRLQGRSGFLQIVLFQAAVPSEIPGYILGILRYPFLRYLAALAIVELPYAAATVYLGSSFLQRNSMLLVLTGALAIGVLFVYNLYRSGDFRF